ncbi:hypothetical protein ACSSS7_002897 [Eimeria intestinalis]
MTGGKGDCETPASHRLSERLLSLVRDDGDVATLAQEDKTTALGADKPRKRELKVTFAPCPAVIKVKASLPYFDLRQLEGNKQAENACGQPDHSEGAAETMMAQQQWSRRPAAAISSSYATTLFGTVSPIIAA